MTANPSPLQLAPTRADRLHPWLSLEMMLGECPLWDAHHQSLLWVSIEAGELHRLTLDPPLHHRIDIGETIGCVGLCRDGDLVAGTRSGIWRLSPAGDKRALLAANPEPTTDHRFNDGRIGPDGRLWIGTMNENKTLADAGLYSFDGVNLVRHKNDVIISNGLAFSPDGHWMYHSDTPRRVIYRHAFHPADGVIGPAETWIDCNTLELTGNPDGAAVDSNGNYWCALFGGGAIARFNADGRLIGRYPLDAPNPTMPAFGGIDLKTLFVTTAREGLSPKEIERWPDAGSLFAMRVDTPGLAEPTFQPVSTP